jgi:hypothetical protein
MMGIGEEYKPVAGRAYRFRYFLNRQDRDVAAVVESIDTYDGMTFLSMSNDVAGCVEEDGTSIELTELTVNREDDFDALWDGTEAKTRE